MITGIIGLLLGMGIIARLAGILIMLLSIAAMWMIFTKAGESGWKSLIPVYNMYILYKICWNSNAFWLFLILQIISSYASSDSAEGFLLKVAAVVVSIALLVIDAVFSMKLSGAFGHGIGFAMGLFFLNTIFILILGLGSSRYYGAQS